MIIKQTIRFLKDNYFASIENLRIEDVRIGSYLCAVKLSDGSVGVSSTIEDTKVHCDKKFRDFGEFTPMQICGKSVLELFETEKSSATVEMLRISCLNAISSKLLDNGNYNCLLNVDPIDLLDITPESNVVIVGAFNSYIKKCAKIGCKLGVLELNPEALSAEHKQYYIPAADFVKVIPQADFLIITGLTLVNNTLENLLQVVENHTKTVVTGPSSSVIPDILFSKKVDIIGGTKISKPELLLDLVSQGAAGYHLFEYCAEKLSIVKQ